MPSFASTPFPQIVANAQAVALGAPYNGKNDFRAFLNVIRDLDRKLNDTSIKVSKDDIAFFAEMACLVCDPFGPNKEAHLPASKLFLKAAAHQNTDPRTGYEALSVLATAKDNSIYPVLALYDLLIEALPQGAETSDAEKIAQISLNPHDLFAETVSPRRANALMRKLIAKRKDLFDATTKTPLSSVLPCLARNPALLHDMAKENPDWFDADAVFPLVQNILYASPLMRAFQSASRAVLTQRKPLAPLFVAAARSMAKKNHAQNEGAQKIAAMVLDLAPEYAQDTLDLIVETAETFPHAPLEIGPIAVRNVARFAKATETLPNELRDLLKRAKKAKSLYVHLDAKKLLRELRKLPKSKPTGKTKPLWRRLLPFCALS